MITKVLLLRRVDKEDYWVSGITLPIYADAGDTFTDMLETHRSYLESAEVIEWLIERYCLQEDVFDEEFDDHNFTFHSLRIDYRPTWVFINEGRETYKFSLSCDIIHSSTGQQSARPAGGRITTP